MTTRTWQCLCGNFQGEVTGDPKLAVFCHCLQCRRYASTAQQLGIWAPENFKVAKGADNLLKYESGENIHRVSCKTCGSFAYKDIKGTDMVAPLGCLEGGPPVKPTMHIMVAHKGDQDIPFPELPQHDNFP